MLTVELFIALFLIAYAMRLDRRRERLAREQAERSKRLIKTLLPHLEAVAARGMK